jgi:2-iminobutanoate/2-iminopropanoate deaminase
MTSGVPRFHWWVASLVGVGIAVVFLIDPVDLSQRRLVVVGLLLVGAALMAAFGGRTASRRQAVASPYAPLPIGPYSQGIRESNLIFLSGQTPLDPVSGLLVAGGIGEQTRQVMANLGAVLAAGGCTFRHVLKTNIYLTDMNDFAAVNEVYASYFDGVAPARTTIGVVALPKGAAIEIEMIAAKM